jgi:peroxiredoxin
MSDAPGPGEERIGSPAPDFRLMAAQGGEIALSGYRGRRLVLWFSKGLF